MKYYILCDDIRLRFEPFGGLLLNCAKQETRNFNNVASAVLAFCIRPRTVAEIKEAMPSVAEFSNIDEFLSKQCDLGILRQCQKSDETKATIYNPIDQNSSDRHLSAPIGIELELTLKCMRSCRYCAYDAHPKAIVEGEISLSQWTSYLRELHDAGIFFVRFTGGDPLTRADFVELLKAADDIGFIITVGSDLTHITDEIVEALASAKNLYALQTTLDGSTPELANLLRGTGNYESVIEGVSRLKRAGVPVILGTVINRKNADDIENIATLAGSLGVDGYCVGPLYAAGRGAASSLRELLPNNDDLTVAARAFKRAMTRCVVPPADPAWLLSTTGLDHKELDLLWHDQGYLVRRPDTLIRIDPFGKVYASIKLKPLLGEETYLGNIQQEHILDIWHSSAGLEKLRKSPSRDSYFGTVIDTRNIIGGKNV